jgi:predicted RNA-binding Zn-ribbon protein involved in translation (DUF1610 family)
MPDMMVPESVTQALKSTESRAAFVCPLCSTTFPRSRQLCSRCGGNIVVPVDDTEVYETVVPMCGPRCHPDRLRWDPDPGPETGVEGWLSRLRSAAGGWPRPCPRGLLNRGST